MMNNPRGIQKVIADGSVVMEPYLGDLTPPDNIQTDADGNPLVLRVTDSLLEYVDQHLKT